MGDPPVLDRALLHATAKAGLTADWRRFEERYPDQEIYGYGFFTHETFYIWSTTFTEAGFNEAAQRDAERFNRPIEHSRRLLRWSPTESPYHPGNEPNLDRIPLLEDASAIVSAATDALDAHYAEQGTRPPDGAHRALTESMYDTLIEVLNELDAEGLFGADRSLLLNVWEPDQTYEDRERFAQRCNPAELAARFCAEELDSYRA